MTRVAPRAHGGQRAPAADWALRAADAELFRALACGTHVRSLREYFGRAKYAQLTALAAKVRHRPRQGGSRVLLLPGMMASRLAPAGRPAAPLWMDPTRIGNGALTRLRLPSPRNIRPCGVLLSNYARLTLELELAGHEVLLHAYDWRRGIDALGAELAARIVREGCPVTLIAHSMGGLVARIAAGMLEERWISRLILIGTPNQGSYAAVQALRGTYAAVRRIALLDRRHSARALATRVFNTFPGLYHLLPCPRRGGIDLFDARSWPAEGPRPRASLLAGVGRARALLAPPDARMAQIVGVNQPTVIGLRRSKAGFEYAVRNSGDGTVPRALAVLPKLASYYIDELHARLADNRQVIRAVLELTARGKTRCLPGRARPVSGPLQRITDAALRGERRAKIDWRRLSSAQRESALCDLESAPLTPSSPAAAGVRKKP